MKEYAKFYMTDLQVKFFNITHLYDGKSCLYEFTLWDLINLKNVQNPEWFTY